MRRIKLTVAYDGTSYCGWQLQSNGITIEEVLNRALTSLFHTPIAVTGASRTDSGVHAMGNVAVFDTDSRMPADKICFALNQRLPEDIRIQASEEVSACFHPRKVNCVKTYEYRILNRKIDQPIGRLYSHFCYFNLDFEKMKQAAACLVGEHDFRSFCTVRSQSEETVRTIYSLSLEKQEDFITIRISGSGFLYNMIRIIAGTLINVGRGICPPEQMEEILEARNRDAAGPTGPAKGLTLVKLEYEKALKEELSGENRHWSYVLDQRAVSSEGTAFLQILRCEASEFEALVRRTVHQAYRNGAKRILVRDLEGGKRPEPGEERPGRQEQEIPGKQETGHRDRIQDGQRFGFYRMKKAEGDYWEAVYDSNSKTN